MRILRDGCPGTTRIVSATELQIAIDFSHDPWRTLAVVILRHFAEQLEDVGFQIEGVDDMLDIISQTGGELQ